jgi:hypothetical protein
MFMTACVVLLVAVLAIPVNLLRRVWEASLAKYLLDLSKPSVSPVPPSSPPAPSGGV